MEPTTIAAQLREIAVYFDLDGDRHRSLAYDKAAKSIEAAKGLHRLLDEGRLEELPGIGPSIARTVGDLARRGSSAILETLRAKWPAVIVELAQLPSVGVQRARKIHQALAPADLDAVAAAARAGQIKELPGFGKLSEQKILKAIEERRTRGTREIHIDAEQHVESLAHYLRAHESATRVEVAGQVRRWCEIVDHLALAIETPDRETVIDRIANYGLVTSIDRSADIVAAQLANGMRCEVHLATKAHFGWAFICATGSPEHVEQLKARAETRGMNLVALSAPDELDVYAALGLPYLPPERSTM